MDATHSSVKKQTDRTFKTVMKFFQKDLTNYKQDRLEKKLLIKAAAIREQGKAAFCPKSKAKDVCPYRTGEASMPVSAWLNGWDIGEREYQMDIKKQSDRDASNEELLAKIYEAALDPALADILHDIADILSDIPDILSDMTQRIEKRRL